MTSDTMTGFGGVSRAETIKIGALAGLIGGVSIWIYEIVVWVNIQHIMALSGLAQNAVGLVFGNPMKVQLGFPVASALGAAIHFGFSAAWGALFAFIWPFFRKRGFEATLVALFYAVFAWIVMHLAIMVAGPDHPNYGDQLVILNGFMSHFFFTVPMAVIVKKRLGGA